MVKILWLGLLTGQNKDSEREAEAQGIVSLLVH